MATLSRSSVVIRCCRPGEARQADAPYVVGKRIGPI